MNKGIDRRRFLRYSAAMGASLALSNFLSSCNWSELDGVRIVDPHAHPDQFYWDNPPPDFIDRTSTLESITELGMVASSFAAVGDGGMYPALSFYESTKYQVSKAQALADAGKVKRVLKTSDIPYTLEFGHLPGAILSIEGGDPLEGDPGRVDEFYGLGVRIITLVHNRNNELGDSIRLEPRIGLTPAGEQVVGRMQELGMVVDLAHADSATLRGAVRISRKPVIDSHTSPKYAGTAMKRLRTWEDMDCIAGTGGVVCTWPFAHEDGTVRKSFSDWAREILEMKRRIGMEHVGLGTDGGGNLPDLIEGYRDVRDLVSLAVAMREAGLSRKDIRAYFGGNILRVLRECIG